MIMKPYEALVIFKTAGSEQDLSRHAAQFEDQIKKLGGRIATSQAMGRRRLAFRIAKQAEGFYHLVRFEAPAEQVRELDRMLRLNEQVVRFMILDGSQPLPAPAAPAPVEV
jgi:small subunit ribosomal protein S6